MKIIGLTGGIASGKTTVAGYLSAKHHLLVIDADYISHQLFVRSQIQNQIIQTFNSFDILDQAGVIDRRKLSQLIFSDLKLKSQLESILHPLIISQIKTQIHNHKERGTATKIILSAPLLIETELADFCDEIIVLDLRPELQFKRLLARQPDLIPLETKQIIAAQTPASVRNKYATHLLLNNSTLAHLFSQVDQIMSLS